MTQEYSWIKKDLGTDTIRPGVPAKMR